MCSAIKSAKYEISKWSDWFDHALQGKGQELEQGYFWKYCENDSLRILNSTLTSFNEKPFRIAEMACGSGRVSLILSESDSVGNVTLVDGAISAIEFARTLVNPAHSEKIDFLRANILSTNLPSNKYDLTWNCGVLEHYEPDGIKKILFEMRRVTKTNGSVVVAIPNIKSLAAIKAFFLGKTSLGRRLEWLPGYRYDTEIPYTENQIIDIARDAGLHTERVEYAGSPTWVSACPALVHICGKLGKLATCSFLTYFIFTKHH